MKTKTVNIVRVLPPNIGVGICEDGSEILVLNGHLFMDEKCEVIITDKFTVLSCLDYSIGDMVGESGDRDGLILIADLKEHRRSKPGRRIFELGKNLCFPDYTCKGLLEIAYGCHSEKKSRIKISQNPVHAIASAKIYGIDFIAAIDKCIEEGIVKSCYYSLKKKNWADGVYADFIARLALNKEGEMVLCAWQAVEKQTTLYYCHGILHKDNKSFKHLDFAHHSTSIEDIVKLFSGVKENPVLFQKKKVFRLDDEEGIIPFNTAFSLMKSFFPLDELVSEYILNEVME